jgi:hypothetical protein
MDDINLIPITDLPAIPPNKKYPVCIFCNIPYNYLGKENNLFFFKCGNCSNKYTMELMSYDIELLEEFNNNPNLLYQHEIKRIVKHLKRVHNISTLKIIKVLNKFPSLYEKAYFLNRLSDEINKDDYIKKLEMNEIQINPFDLYKVKKCKLFNRRYRLIHICKNCVEFDKICFRHLKNKNDYTLKTLDKFKDSD